MTLLQKIKEDFKKALKNQKENKVRVLKLLLASIINAEIAKKREKLSEEEIIKIIRKEIKKREEAFSLYLKGDRPELAQKEREEINILKKYIPPSLSDEEIIKIIKEVIKKIGSESSGAIIGAVMREVKGRAEGRRVAALVQKILSS